MSLRPLNDYLVVTVEPEVKTFGSIVLVGPQLIRKGVVLSVGRGRQYCDGVYKPSEVKVGDRIAFLAASTDSAQGRQNAKVLEDGHVILRETDVLFVIDEGDPEISL